MKKVLFIDRDGTIIVEPPDEQVDSLEKLEFMPGVITAMARIARETDFELVIVTNQDGLGTESFPEETFWPAHNKMLRVLESEGIRFSEIFIDRTFPEQRSPTRKPGTLMLGKYLAGGVDLASSYVIGDRLTDVELARNLGCSSILVSNVDVCECELCTTDWSRIASFLVSKPRMSVIRRKTAETDITIKLTLEGSGKSSIKTGIGFFDHMLQQVARHGGLDLEISAEGDLQTDEHHTVEDVGLCLGEAFSKALGSKKGIARYAFMLPMDDSLATVAIDFGGRPWLTWKVKFSDTRIGSMPAELFSHFFKSFTDTARCSLNISAEGENDHHIAESVYKAFGRTVREAVAKTGKDSVPSTKGVL